MKKTSEAKPPLNVPKFRSEDEEAAWWEANEDYIVERLKKFGSVAPPLKRVRSAPPTELISLRISTEDIARARQLAEKRGIGYQTILKEIIHSGLGR